jgi:CO/xanthine dehydrogenase Mo-binding subunit
VRVSAPASDAPALVEIHTAAAEVGQGVVGIQEQIARTELGVADVRVLAADTAIASAGSASASRLTWIAGGAVHDACGKLRAELLDRAAARHGADRAAIRLHEGVVVRDDGTPVASVAELVAGEPAEAHAIYRHRDTHVLDERGQGDVHAGFAFVAHRAVVDVDVELGLVRVVELTCAQDVGRALNPLALEGQLEGGSIQGLGLALSEELLIDDGIVRSRSLGTYRIPTIVDAPPVGSIVLELADPDTPYGLRGVGEMPSLSSTPAVLAALRAATGRPLTRVPVRPDHLIGLQEDAW